ncbi:folylpolyglutamate synthase-like [Dorcoceras hygrometricum]|uniref:Folylpolyglutamate synthase-like n=1 Tax=Dorcoceras hygrometricum TaxID=472368 RepID=A0A2Z7AF25_9LAMI|nr:folylpolyglutamate synthase-like [Dorcoceras hygrometricum]
MTSPLLIQTTAYCTSLQELAANNFHQVDASQNVTILKTLALSDESTYHPVDASQNVTVLKSLALSAESTRVGSYHALMIFGNSRLSNLVSASAAELVLRDPLASCLVVSFFFVFLYCPHA